MYFLNIVVIVCCVCIGILVESDMGNECAYFFTVVVVDVEAPHWC